MSLTINNILEYAEEVDAREKGPKCMTRNEKDSEKEGFSEDCLVLKVQVKKTVLENKEKLPVLFYIHGGGFNGGSGQLDSSKAVNYQGVTVVSVNYRLGPFGFLYLNEPEEGQDFQGNWGLLDQQAGMKWVHMFAGLFGGDKDSVTINGASAGSESVWRHFTMPSSWPYFTRVAPTGIGLVAGSKSAGKKTKKLTNATFKEAGCAENDLKCLRAISVADLKAAVGKAENVGRNDNTAMVLNSAFAPVHTSDMFESTLFDDIYEGRFKPNTDILWAYTQWEAFGMSNGFIGGAVRPGGLLEEYRKDFTDAKAATGHKVPYPYPHYIYEKLFGEDATLLDLVLHVFGCTEGEDCEDQLARFCVATQFACSGKYAMDNNFKGQRDDVGNYYPVQYEEPNCAKDEATGKFE